ncbi:MAG: hypothetical protein JXA71_11515 [Chitinispirillaceae bacterium]|nr:hypothetical protein [Chitinispirillaceae bacterium]
MGIAEKYLQSPKDIAGHVTIVIAVKTRRAEDFHCTIEARSTDIGGSCMQEVKRIRPVIYRAIKNTRRFPFSMSLRPSIPALRRETLTDALPGQCHLTWN